MINKRTEDIKVKLRFSPNNWPEELFMQTDPKWVSIATCCLVPDQPKLSNTQPILNRNLLV
jgi:hypothetical protein